MVYTIGRTYRGDIGIMFGLFKSPQEKAKKKYLEVLEQAQKAQRNGDIKEYSFLMEKAEIYKKDAGI